MNAPPRLWAWAAEALLAFGFACLVHAARRLQTHALAGPRGARRALAQNNLPLLRSLEPLLRAATAWVARWPMIETRDALTLLLRQSGNALGLTATNQFPGMAEGVAAGGAGVRDDGDWPAETEGGENHPRCAR